MNMEITMAPVKGRPQAARRPKRLLMLVACGVLLLALGVMVRTSAWARDQEYGNLPLEDLALVIHDRPGDALVFLHYGSSLLRAGNLRDAEAAFQRAIDLDRRIARAHVGLATVYLHQGLAQRAAVVYEEACRLEPRNSLAHLGAAQAYHTIGSPSRAIPHLELITRLEPRKPVAWYTLGKVYGDAHLSDKALAALRKAVELQPDQPDYWRDLGQLARHYTKIEEAEKAFNRALELQPRDPVTHYWLGQHYAQTAAGGERAVQLKAISHLKKAISLDTTLSEPHFELGQIYERQGDLDEAERELRLAQKLAPEQTRPLYSLGRCLQRQGKKAEGELYLAAFKKLVAAKMEVEGLENRVKANLQDLQLHLRLARAYNKYGNTTGALRHFDHYLQQRPGDASVAREREKAARAVNATAASDEGS